MEQSILHISPTYYSIDSVVGGGERYINYMARAIIMAGKARGRTIPNSILAFGDRPGKYVMEGGIPCEVMQGQPWNPYSVDVAGLNERLKEANIVVVHQALTAFGLFVASHARMANKMVIAEDAGGGEHRMVHHTPEMGHIFDFCVAYSDFCVASFSDLDARVETIYGPVDTEYYRPSRLVQRNPWLVVAVGRILPHKGFDRIINALPDDMTLLIVGTNYDQEYYQYLMSLPNASRFRLLENLNDREVKQVMQTGGVFVHASTHRDYKGRYYAKPELLGLAPLEALSVGTPALVSNAGSLPELARINGCLSFRDDEELAALLRKRPEFPKMFPSDDEIHEDVERKYGLLTYGSKFLDAIEGKGDRA